MRLLVCGSRIWLGAWEDIAVHLPEDDDLTIIHGGCSRVVDGVQRSVDMIADFVAPGLGHAVDAYPVDVRLDGRWPAAGPRRNERMLRESKPDAGIAFGALWRFGVLNPNARKPTEGWAKTGTGGMVALLINAGLPVRWVAEPDAAAVELSEMPLPGAT